jgi:hypothetical protein
MSMMSVALSTLGMLSVKDVLTQRPSSKREDEFVGDKETLEKKILTGSFAQGQEGGFKKICRALQNILVPPTTAQRKSPSFASVTANQFVLLGHSRISEK